MVEFCARTPRLQSVTRGRPHRSFMLGTDGDAQLGEAAGALIQRTALLVASRGKRGEGVPNGGVLPAEIFDFLR
jgi:hypothetical protein